MEAVLTIGLVSVILGTASGAQNLGVFGALGVGGYIALAGLWGSPISGASMNPARTFGPDLDQRRLHRLLGVHRGPLLGAVLAVGVAFILRGRGGGMAGSGAGAGCPVHSGAASHAGLGATRRHATRASWVGRSGAGVRIRRDPRRGGRGMGQALLLCLVGSLYPVALLGVLTYLGSARPLPTAAAFLAGGVIISFVTGTALVVLFRQFHLDPDHHRTPSAAVYIGLGVGVIVAASVWLVINHRRREHETSEAPRAGEPTEKTLRAAFVAGALIYLPMLSYFAAIKIIADQNYDLWQTVGALIACVVVSLAVTELPIVVVALVGERADPLLHGFARFVSKNTSTILLLTGLGVGVYLVVKGVGQL